MREDRNRQAEALEDLDRALGQDMDGAAGYLLQTFTEATYPTAAQAVYACHPVTLNGADTEGTVPTFVADSATTVYAGNVGSTVPPAGSYVIGVSCGGRIVFRWDS